LNLVWHERFRSQNAETYYIFYYGRLFTELAKISKLLNELEAAIGIEPMNKGLQFDSHAAFVVAIRLMRSYSLRRA